MQLPLQYIQKGKPSPLGCEFDSAQTPLSHPQYSSFVDLRPSELMAGVQSYGRMQGHHRTD